MALRTLEAATVNIGRVRLTLTYDDVSGQIRNVVVANNGSRAATARVVQPSQNFTATLDCAPGATQSRSLVARGISMQPGDETGTWAFDDFLMEVAG